MNELEIATWALFVESNNWGESGQTLEDFLLITALQVKVRN